MELEYVKNFLTVETVQNLFKTVKI